MKKRKKSVKFKGWDWTELVPALLDKSTDSYYNEFKGEESESHLNKAEHEMLNDLQDFMYDMIDEITDSRPEVRKKGLEKIAVPLKYIRRFVLKVAECEELCGCRHTLIKGLYDIEDEWTFLSYTAKLLDCLWT